MFKSLSKSLLWRGILALIIGVIALAWPGITIAALVVIFAIAAFASGFIEISRAIASRRAGTVFGLSLLALVDVAAGVVALAWPGITALVLVICIGVWAVFAGCFELTLSFVAGGSPGQRLLFGLGGLIWILFGIVLFARPDIGAVALAEIFGFFSLILGVSSLVMSANIHDAGDSASKLFP
ncbi:MAG: DUF308 domain-containing protein [Acidimicrobiales bacterium]